MHTKGWSFLQVLLNKYNHQLDEETFRAAFLQHISEEEAREFQRADVHSTDISAALHLKEQCLHQMHYSWLLPIFKNFSPSFQGLYLSCLTKEQSTKLASQLGISLPSTMQTPASLQFLTQQLCRYLPIENTLPWQYHTSTSLTALGTLTKQGLTNLISLLGIHDIAAAAKKIVDNKRLQSIYSALTSLQLKFLRQCLHHKESISARPIDLITWAGDSKSLQKMIQLRGMARLSRALSGQHPDLIWSIVHTLDTGRGALLEKQVVENEIPHITLPLAQQVVSTFNYLKQKGKV